MDWDCAHIRASEKVSSGPGARTTEISLVTEIAREGKETHRSTILLATRPLLPIEKSAWIGAGRKSPPARKSPAGPEHAQTRLALAARCILSCYCGNAHAARAIAGLEESHKLDQAHLLLRRRGMLQGWRGDEKRQNRGLDTCAQLQ